MSEPLDIAGARARAAEVKTILAEADLDLTVEKYADVKVKLARRAALLADDVVTFADRIEELELDNAGLRGRLDQVRQARDDWKAHAEKLEGEGRYVSQPLARVMSGVYLAVNQEGLARIIAENEAQIRAALLDLLARRADLPPSATPAEPEFYVLSLYRSRCKDRVCTWWGVDSAGYYFRLCQAGRYTLTQVTEKADHFDDGAAALAIPCAAVERLAVPADEVVSIALERSRPGTELVVRWEMLAGLKRMYGAARKAAASKARYRASLPARRTR